MKHAQIKDHILKTASQLFYKKGYNATGINEIISTSGIAKATLYNHFASKEVVCLAYLENKNTAFLRDIENFCAVRPNGAAQIMAIFDYLKKLYDQEHYNGCWGLNTFVEVTQDNAQIRNEIKRHKKQFITFLEQLLASNFPFINPETAAILARKIYLLYESALVESNVHSADWPIKDASAMCATFFS